MDSNASHMAHHIATSDLSTGPGPSTVTIHYIQVTIVMCWPWACWLAMVFAPCVS